MKLLDQSLKYLSFSILLIVSVWAAIFYAGMIDEIRESIDEGLENYKRLIIRKAATDSTVLLKNDFDQGFYTVHEIGRDQALAMTSHYADTFLDMQDDDDLGPEPEPVRMLTTAFENHGRFYELRIINSMVEEDDLVEDLLRSALWLYVLLVASIIIVHNVILRRLWKPFYALLDQLKRFRLGSSGELPAVITTTKEFLDLQEVLTTVLTHNLETYEQQKEFTGNASHELQTPLAIATGKLELLLERGDLGDERAARLSEVLQIITRLTKLNRSLLLLARIESRQLFDNRPVSLNIVTGQVMDDLRELAEFKNITVKLVESAELTADMDPALASILVSNLVKNAIVHNAPGGVTDIEISAGVLRVCNSGTAALDAGRIFNRFYRSSAGAGGTGLGLAIVKAVCVLYSFNVSYFFGHGRHCFEVRFRNS
jgi:signal transduction histidine kinase